MSLFSMTKEINNRIKKQATASERAYLHMVCVTMGRHSECRRTQKRNTKKWLTMGERTDAQFSKEDRQPANHRSHSISPILREIQVKTITRCRLIPVGTITIKKV